MARTKFPTVGFISLKELLEGMLALGHVSAVPVHLLPDSPAGQRLAVIALEAYGFVDAEGRPTRAYSNLVDADPVTRRQMFRAAAIELYREVASMVEQGADEDALMAYFERESGYKGSTAIKAVNHYNGASLQFGLPRNEHLRVLRGYTKTKPVRRNRGTGAVVEEPAPERSSDRPDSANGGRAVKIKVAGQDEMVEARPAGSIMQRYLEALLRSVENQVAHGEVPSTDLLERIDKYVGLTQTKLPASSNQDGSG